MKHQKIAIVFIVFALLLSSILAVAAYTNLSNHLTTVTLATVEAPTPPPFQLQVISPLDNCTYGRYDGPENITSDQAPRTTYSLILPLNITANEESSRIAYSLDGSDNITFNENTTATLTLSYGVHNLTVYATNIEGIASESNTIFTVGYDYPLSAKITMEQVQEATRYFEGRGLKVQAEAPVDDSKLQSIWSMLYAGSVDVVSKENFADIVIAHGIDTIWVYQDSNQVSFYINVYGNSWFHALPIVYSYGATLA
jgi:hypothetical protein